MQSLVDQHVAEAGLARLEVDDGLVGIAHGQLLDPGPHVLVDRQLEHLPDLRRAADSGTRQAPTPGDEGAEAKGDGLLRQADLHHGTVQGQQADVCCPRSLQK